MQLANKKIIPIAPKNKPPFSSHFNTKISSSSLKTDDSPDVPVTNQTSSQSENSIFILPADESVLLNSNNSTSTGSSPTVYGTDYLTSIDNGNTWGGSIQGSGGSNYGDPAAAINLNGRYYIGFINSNGGQSVAYSTNSGSTWTTKVIANSGSTSGMLDKNHLWVDNSPSSPYVGNVYSAWTDFGGAHDNQIDVARSTNDGVNWSAPVNVSAAVNAGNHNQGVNLQTGPNGEVYAIWAIYDSWPSDEGAIGFAKSTNGGSSFAPATRIISNIRGIRNTEVQKNHRVNAFPVMAADISTGPYSGSLYVVWTNTGVPGTNSGTNKSIYMIKSTNQGSTWSTPLRINQGPLTEGKEAYFPWITCDPVTGYLACIFYDDRNVSATQAETFVAISMDGGNSWEDFKVSDVAFTPQPIQGMAGGYMGDYLAIAARNNWVYPCWTDNRTGTAMTYVSPIQINNRTRPMNLLTDLDSAAGTVVLTWDFDTSFTFQNFIIYRDNIEIGTATNTNYTDNLPNYGIFNYKVTAMHTTGESAPAKGSLQWGNPDIDVNVDSLVQTLLLNQTASQTFIISNTGELPLVLNISNSVNNKNTLAYCAATGGCDEYISNVNIGTINSTSTCNNYSNYTNLSTSVSAGVATPITITNGNPYSSDQCGIWIDWNQDQDFDDPGETITVAGSPGNGPYTANIIPPANAAGGNTTMRIRITYTGTLSPCGTTSYGEVEDYTLTVNNWLLVENGNDTLMPDSSKAVMVTFKSENIQLGNYSGSIIIASNDVDEPLISIPVSLTVTDNIALSANAYAQHNAICTGDSTQLFANAIGGTGNYAYAWTSIPAGFTSFIANPVVFPNNTTNYIVTVTDSFNSVVDTVLVSLTGQPGNCSLPSGPVQVYAEGPNSTYSISEVTNATSYQWVISPANAGVISGGGTTGLVNWNDSFTGNAFIKVRALNSCETGEFSDSLQVTVLPGNNIEKIDISRNIKINVFPNPNNGLFSIAMHQKKTFGLTLTVFNAFGEKVYEEKNISFMGDYQQTLDLRTLQNGLYMIKIEGDNVKGNYKFLKTN